MSFFSWLFRRSKPKKLKIGLALGSGGAKGFAHLGALKAFEENGIEFSFVAGTSIGSVVGAFVAQGYSSRDIYELLKSNNFGDLKNLVMISMDTSSIFKVIDRELGNLNIEEMKMPYSAVATVLETGEEHVFSNGSLEQAISASCSIPPFFKPKVIGGVRYIDGAFTNSIPADVVRKMGADYIIGIDLSTHEQKTNTITKFFPTYKSKVSKPWEKGYEYSDVTLHPDLSEYSSTSINSGLKMYDIGYNTAMEMMPKILSDIKSKK